MSGLLGPLKFILGNFLVPIVFFVLFRAVGTQAAIGFAVATALLQLVVMRQICLKPTPFFLASSFFTILFGGLDLLFDDSRFYRLAPFFHNLLIGTILLVSLFTRLSLIEWFARGLPERFQPEALQLSRGYLRKLTGLWALFFYLKSAFYLYISQRVDLGELILIRALVGNASFLLMVLGEILYRKYFRKK